MLLNFILFLIAISLIFLLVHQIKKPSIHEYIKPDCKFIISKPIFYIDEETRIAKYCVLSKNKNRFFLDFPIAFKFYSNEKFRSKIRITYRIPDDDDEELIYDKLVEFEDVPQEHIYYINDIIVGKINIEIYTYSNYGSPTIKFEILANNLCETSPDHKIEINFPK